MSTTITSTRYEASRRIVRSLRDSGADAVLPLPRIMVAGQQSAGKSAMLEVLSKMKFPQSSGTCTRQCTELRMIKTEPGTEFRGSLKIRWGRKKGKQDKERWNVNLSGHKEDAYLDRTGTVVVPIPSMEDVPEILIHATERLLGPDPSGFSDSVIVLEIASEFVENFEVIDTPGIVEAGESEEEIGWLREMISGYMKEENTIILATVECSGDLKNQRFLEMVKRADPTQR
eukprot:231262_1